MRWITPLSLTVLLLASAAHAADRTTCEGKRGWQREIVRGAVERWLASDARPEDLVELVQAEHGIVACAAGSVPPRLHTTVLPRGLEVDQLGGVLLANELAWSGLLPPPETGLAGEYFRVKPRHRRGEPRP
jgi:hypothetical protein